MEFAAAHSGAAYASRRAESPNSSATRPATFYTAQGNVDIGAARAEAWSLSIDSASNVGGAP